MNFLIIKWPNFVYLLVDPEFVFLINFYETSHFVPLTGWTSLTGSTDKETNRQTSLSVCLLDGVWRIVQHTGEKGAEFASKFRADRREDRRPRSSAARLPGQVHAAGARSVASPSAPKPHPLPRLFRRKSTCIHGACIYPWYMLSCCLSCSELDVDWIHPWIGLDLVELRQDFQGTL